MRIDGQVLSAAAARSLRIVRVKHDVMNAARLLGLLFGIALAIGLAMWFWG